MFCCKKNEYAGKDSEDASKNYKEGGKNLKEIIASRKTARRQSTALHDIERTQKAVQAVNSSKESWLEAVVSARRKERQDQERKHREELVASDPQHRDYEVIVAARKAEQERLDAFRRALSCHPGTYLERSKHPSTNPPTHPSTHPLTHPSHRVNVMRCGAMCDGHYTLTYNASRYRHPIEQHVCLPRFNNIQSLK